MEIVYVIQHRHWFWTDDSWITGNDVIQAYRSYESAEAECQRLIDEQQKNDEYEDKQWQYEVVQLELNTMPMLAPFAKDAEFQP